MLKKGIISARLRKCFGRVNDLAFRCFGVLVGCCKEVSISYALYGVLMCITYSFYKGVKLIALRRIKCDGYDGSLVFNFNCGRWGDMGNSMVVTPKSKRLILAVLLRNSWHRLGLCNITSLFAFVLAR